MADKGSLTRFAWLSIAAAVGTMTLKFIAYLLTGSVGLLSDALESIVNLVAAVVALVVLHIAAKPPDDEHAYGHAKAEYFSAGVEGTLILVAAASIAWAALGRLLHPQELDNVGVGLLVSMVAAAVNGAVALVLLRNGRRYRSITLEADGKHLMTDVWTSGGVLIAVLVVQLTGWLRLDPLIAFVVAGNIVWAGTHLLRRSTRGLMDVGLPAEQRAAIEAVLERYTSFSVQFHALRTREAGRRAFMSVHVLVPGVETVQRAHDLVERVEADLRAAVPDITVVTHIEPLEDPRSFADEGLDRRALPPFVARPPRPGG
ncbi:MAG: cation diffusion facilitator family transporter [Acidimicrobiales bacterium]|nr:cation diffusion facilitator family transporter [Acidimicrobiales bacterium]